MASSNPYIAGTIGAASVIGGSASAAMSADDKVAYLKALQNGETDLANSIAQKASGEQAQLSSLYSPLTEGYTKNAQNYYDAANNADFSQYNLKTAAPYTGLTTDQKNSDTEALLNPERKAIEKAATGAVEQSSANAGKLFSGAAGKAIAQTVAPIEAQQWNTAQNAATGLEQNQYQKYLDEFNQARSVADFNKGNYLSSLGQKQNAVNAQGQNFNTKAKGSIDITSAADQAALQAQQIGMQAGAQEDGTATGWEAALQGGLGALSKL